MQTVLPVKREGREKELLGGYIVIRHSTHNKLIDSIGAGTQLKGSVPYSRVSCLLPRKVSIYIAGGNTHGRRAAAFGFGTLCW